MIKTRFAPSPTGLIHIGNARTAIHSALASKCYEAKGHFLLRIENTDEERSESKYIKAIQQDLKALGWQWQEGITVGGEHAPYLQSERKYIYQEFFDQLLDEGYAYRCFCSEEDLIKMRREQKLAGQPPRYNGHCSRLDPSVVQKKLLQNIPYVLRFNTSFKHDDQAEIQFTDLVKGHQRFPRTDIGDFIIRKNNGTPTFFFSNAIDDSLMNITHVFRGDDHLTNTPRQLMLLQALKLKEPKYAHLSTIVGEDGTPFSKRNGSRSIQELLQEGWLSIAINNYLARLGHYYSSDKLLSNKELSKYFKIKNLGKAAAKFDWVLLKHWQRQAIMQLNVQQQWQWLEPVLGKCLDTAQGELFAQTICPNILLPDEALTYYKIIYSECPKLKEQERLIMQEVPTNFFKVALVAYEEKPDFQHISNRLKEVTGAKGKKLFMPLRLALTGQTHGPEMHTIVSLLPKQIIKNRLQYWLN